MVKNPWFDNNRGDDSADVRASGSSAPWTGSPSEQGREPESSYEDQFLKQAVQASAKSKGTVTGQSGESPSGSSFSSGDESDAATSISSAATGLLTKEIEAKRAALAQEELPRLSQKNSRRVAGNFNELPLIQGNLNELNRNLSTLYCTSCFAGEGKTITALQMAYGLAVYGKKRVLLTETKTEKPALAQLFGTPNDCGLKNFLHSEVELSQAIIPTAYEGLFILTAGRDTNGGGEMEVQGFLDKVKGNFDYVIIDGQALLNFSEAVNFATMVDAFILTVECERTKWEVVQIANRKLTAAGARSLGVVLNKRKYYVPRFIYRMISNR